MTAIAVIATHGFLVKFFYYQQFPCITIIFLSQQSYHSPVAVLGKILGGWPFIIWEATTAKRNYYKTN